MKNINTATVSKIAKTVLYIALAVIAVCLAVKLTQVVLVKLVWPVVKTCLMLLISGLFNFGIPGFILYKVITKRTNRNKSESSENG